MMLQPTWHPKHHRVPHARPAPIDVDTDDEEPTSFGLSEETIAVYTYTHCRYFTYALYTALGNIGTPCSIVIDGPEDYDEDYHYVLKVGSMYCDAMGIWSKRVLLDFMKQRYIDSNGVCNIQVSLRDRSLDRVESIPNQEVLSCVEVVEQMGSWSNGH